MAKNPDAEDFLELSKENVIAGVWDGNHVERERKKRRSRFGKKDSIYSIKIR